MWWMYNIGNKSAKTKTRLLNENVSMAVIDEKFQINTVMDVNADGVPIKDKIVRVFENHQEDDIVFIKIKFINSPNLQ